MLVQFLNQYKTSGIVYTRHDESTNKTFSLCYANDIEI